MNTSSGDLALRSASVPSKVGESSSSPNRRLLNDAALFSALFKVLFGPDSRYELPPYDGTSERRERRFLPVEGQNRLI